MENKTNILSSINIVDDVLLIVDSKNKLQEAVIEWDEILRSKRMMINQKKSKTMQVGRTKGGKLSILMLQVTWEDLEQVPCYEYLRTIIQQIYQEIKVGQRKVLIILLMKS